MPASFAHDHPSSTEGGGKGCSFPGDLLRRWLRRLRLAPSGAFARIPDGLSAVEAAPLMCAGVTTFNALRNAGARPGDLVAVLGVGGLGHLGVQFASKMGFDMVAIAPGRDEKPLAHRLGARRPHERAVQQRGLPSR